MKNEGECTHPGKYPQALILMAASIEPKSTSKASEQVVRNLDTNFIHADFQEKSKTIVII